MLVTSPVPLFLASIDDQGRIRLDARDRFLAYAATFRGQRVELLLRKRKVQRSTQANRYYWGVVVAMIAEYLGYTPEEAHEAIAWHLLQRHDERGAKLPRRRSTASLTTEEFQEYLEQVRTFAATELGLAIPDPGATA